MNELVICKELYNFISLQKTVAAYKGFATIDIIEEDSVWSIRFVKCKYGTERTMKEFENYLIGVVNQTNDNL